MRPSAYGHLLPKSTTNITTMMIAASPPLLRLNDAESDPEAPAAVSTAAPEPAPGALCSPAGDVGADDANVAVEVADMIDCAEELERLA